MSTFLSGVGHLCNTPPPSETRRSQKEAANIGPLQSVPAFINTRLLVREHGGGAEFPRQTSSAHVLLGQSLCSCPAVVMCGVVVTGIIQPPGAQSNTPLTWVPRGR